MTTLRDCSCSALWLVILIGITRALIKSDVLADLPIPEVKITEGTIRGVTLTTLRNRSISAFRGIPYAEPPVGELRFSSPIPAKSWNETLDASQDRSVCLQSLVTGTQGEEDCLFINVFVPQRPENGDSSLLPVMVYVPGGAFARGGATTPMCGPRFLLDENVILVTFNYRLGPLGFLSTGDRVAPGNWGLKDQVLALKWVQKNIEKFKGDPNRVTIFGPSAGAASVQYLALSESTNGLFHQFITQSGTADSSWGYRPSASYSKIAFRLGEHLNCPTSESTSLLECLRKKNGTEIIETNVALNEWDATYSLVRWGPTDEPDVPGAFITDSPKNLIDAGKMRDLPCISGGVSHESDPFLNYMVPGTEALEDFLNNFDEILPMILHLGNLEQDLPNVNAAVKEFYFNSDLTGDKNQSWFNIAKVVTDTMFNYPMHSILRKQLTFAKNPIYFYSFRYRGTYSKSDSFHNALSNGRTTHNDELLYLFPQLEALFQVSIDELSEAELNMIHTMVQLWTSFAINGTPSTKNNNTIWTRYSTKDNYLLIGNGSDESLMMQYVFLEERMKFWDDLITTDSGGADAFVQSLTTSFLLIIALLNILL